MTLTDWLNSGWLKTHTPDRHEIRELLTKVDRDIRDGATTEISLDWQLAIAYNACLGCATIALSACGYRVLASAGQHYRKIQSLRFTLQPPPELILSLEAISKKRAIVTYDEAGAASDAEVNETGLLAKELRQLLVEWLEREHPNMVG